MIKVKHLTLDILKPRTPNLLVFAEALAAVGHDIHVTLTVHEVDDKTETLAAVIEGENIDFDAIQQAIKSQGGSLHSIDAVKVINDAQTEVAG